MAAGWPLPLPPGLPLEHDAQMHAVVLAHLRVGAASLAGECHRHGLLHRHHLSPAHTVVRVDERGEVPAQLLAAGMVLNLFSFLLDKHLRRRFVTVSTGVGIGDADVENSQHHSLAMSS